MANYNILKQAIQDVIRTNGNNEITGALLQQSLLAMINSLGTGYQFIGVATPSTNPGTPDQKVFVVAGEAGAYTNFGGLVVNEGELAFLYYDTTWRKGVFDAAGGGISRLLNGGSIQTPVAMTSTVKGRIAGRTSSGRIIYSTSSTATVKLAFFPVTAGKTYVVHIPRTGNNYTKVTGYTSVVLTEDATADLSKPGTCLDTAGSSSAYDATFVADNYPYVVFTYNSAYGEVTMNEVTTIEGIIQDERDIAELKGREVIGAARYEGALGMPALRMYAASLASGGAIVANDFPRSNKCGNEYSFACKVTTFDKLVIAQGYNTYRCVYFVLDNTSISVYFKRGESGSAEVKASATHGLTISTILQVNITHGDNGKYSVRINTLGGSFSTELDWAGYDANGVLEVISDGSALTDVKFSATNRNFSRPLWIMGASYEGVTNDRWPYYAKGMGYFHYLLNGYAGRAPKETYEEFVRALTFGCPKFLYWTMFGNGSASDYTLYTGLVKTICEEKGITLIVLMRPNAPAIDATYAARKTAVQAFIDEGVRYVDSRNALSASPDAANGWYEGYLADDETHPTTKGARALAYAVIADLPEIMQYK